MASATEASATEASETEASETEASEIHPWRLTMISMGDNCMFCKEPQGTSYITYVALEDKIGYISCAECREKMQSAVEFWRTHRAYGQANHLKERTDLKVRRTNGDIETGWCLNNPLVRYEDNGIVTIRCYNAEKNIGRWCQMETILELNS